MKEKLNGVKLEMRVYGCHKKCCNMSYFGVLANSNFVYFIPKIGLTPQMKDSTRKNTIQSYEIDDLQFVYKESSKCQEISPHYLLEDRLWTHQQ